MNIFVNVVGQNLQISGYPRKFVAGTKDFIQFVFSFDDDWKGLLTYAQFTQGEDHYYSYLDENHSVKLHPMIADGTCKLSLHGDDGTVIAHTEEVSFSISGNTLDLEDFNENLPQSLYGQLAKKITNTKEEFMSLIATPEEAKSYLGIE